MSTVSDRQRNEVNEVVKAFGVLVRALPRIGRKLPEDKQQSLRVYIKYLAQLLQSDHDPEVVHEELEDVFEAIQELFGRVDVELRDHLVDPRSQAAQKAREWFKKIGQRIRKLRRQANLRQVDLARKAGLSQGAISRIERGELAATHVTIEKIAKALGVKPGDIDPSWD